MLAVFELPVSLSHRLLVQSDLSISDYRLDEHLQYQLSRKEHHQVLYPNRMTISSDGQGSLPMYSSDGEFLGMGVGQSSCLLKEVKECVFKTEIPLEIAISTITSNPADILRLKGKGKVEEGYDADLCILDQELQLVEVIAKGNTVYTK